MLTIRIENKIIETLNSIKSGLRSLLLFGNPSRVKFGKGVRLAGQICLGENVRIWDYSKIRGRNISIEDNVFIHENVLIRSNEYIKIGKGTTINKNCTLLAKIIIGKDCSIAPNVVIVGSNHNHYDLEKTIKEQGIVMVGITIEDDVWISANATILDGVTIGRGSIIAAGAVVNKNVPPMTIVGGVPAHFIKSRN